MDGFVHINELNFNEEVLQSSTPVLLEFGGVWCKPCKDLEPLLLRLGGNWKERVKLAKLDVTECPGLTTQYQVLSLPTTILFIEGKAKEYIVGLIPEKRIRDSIDPYL